jgi:hypothetical protein
MTLHLLAKSQPTELQAVGAGIDVSVTLFSRPTSSPCRSASCRALPQSPRVSRIIEFECWLNPTNALTKSDESFLVVSANTPDRDLVAVLQERSLLSTT